MQHNEAKLGNIEHSAARMFDVVEHLMQSQKTYYNGKSSEIVVLHLC